MENTENARKLRLPYIFLSFSVQKCTEKCEFQVNFRTVFRAFSAPFLYLSHTFPSKFFIGRLEFRIIRLLNKTNNSNKLYLNRNPNDVLFFFQFIYKIHRLRQLFKHVQYKLLLFQVLNYNAFE